MEAVDKCKVRTSMIAGSGSWIASVYEVTTDRRISTGSGVDEEGCIRDAIDSFNPDKLSKTAEKLTSENEDLRKRIDDLESKVETEPSEDAAVETIDDPPSAPPKRKTRKKRVTKSPRSDFVIDPEQNISGK